MSVEKFELSSKKLGGALILTYENGVLKSFINGFKRPLNVFQAVAIKRVLQFNSDNIHALDYKAIGLECKLISSTNGGQLIALFCAAYKKNCGASYLVSKKDAGLLKQLPLKSEDDYEQIVQAYFECTAWWATPKSIGGMVSRINELHQWIKTSTSESTDQWHFPAGFSKAREQECKTNEELQAYWRHLRALGYKKTRVGIVDKWARTS